MNVDESNIDGYGLEVPGNRQKPTWGGKRPGAGRKPTLKDPVRFTGDVERPDVDALEAIATERGVSVASLVRSAVHAHVNRQRKKV